MKIEKRYMVVPVSRYSRIKRFIFSKDSRVIIDYQIQLCTKEPEYFYYVDMRWWLGQELDFSCRPQVDFVPAFADEKPAENLYEEKFRPAAHFSPAQGWMNDPNGLCYYKGQYHMFFQHNPAGPCWQNMHWGHAVSQDLFHWQEKEIALCPDEWGTNYSGSAIVDRENRSGLKENDEDVLLLFYTACPAGAKTSENHKTTQCLAYSTDGGETFKKYAHNPIIPHIVGENRDPKVVWAEEENCYFLALYLEGDQYALFTSENLLNWEPVQTVELKGDRECPDFYPLTTQKGNRFWVLTGANDKYLIGTLQNKKFVPVQEVKTLQFTGTSYAAQTFSGLPESHRFRIAWNTAVMPESPFNCSMCTPVRMRLWEEENGEISLRVQPLKKMDNIEKKCAPDHLEGKAQDILLHVEADDETEIEVSLLGCTFLISGEKREISAIDLSGKTCLMPLYDQDGKADIRLISDTLSIEVYANEGKGFMVVSNIADYDLNRLTARVLKGKGRVFSETKVIENIWGK